MTNKEIFGECLKKVDGKIVGSFDSEDGKKHYLIYQTAKTGLKVFLASNKLNWEFGWEVEFPLGMLHRSFPLTEEEIKKLQNELVTVL